MLHEMGVETGVDLRALIEASRAGAGGARPPARRPRAARRPGRLAPRLADPGPIGCSDEATPSGRRRRQGLLRAEELFAEDVVFRSPVVFKPYEGRDASAAARGRGEVFEDFRYTTRSRTGDTAVLVFEARVGRPRVDGVDILRFDDEGRIAEMMVMVRPMSGMNALAEAMQRGSQPTGSG